MKKKLKKTNRYCWICGKNMYLTPINYRFFCINCQTYKDELKENRGK